MIRPRWLVPVTDSALVLLAGWTLASQVAVYRGASFDALMGLAPWALLVSIGLLVFIIRAGKRSATGGSDEPERRGEVAAPASLVFQVTAVAALFGFIHVRWPNSWVTFAGMVLALGLAYRGLRTAAADSTGAESKPSAPAETPAAKFATPAILVLALLAAALCFSAVNFGHDDALYLNVVASALDHPDEALFRHDHLHEATERPFSLPVYALHSYELGVAALARTTGIDYRTIYYGVLPALFGFLLALGAARLCERLRPGSAVTSLVALLVIYWAWGDEHRTYGSFGPVRMFQGKAVLCSLAVPLLWCHVLAALDEPRAWKNWVLLVASVVAMLGLSSSGLIVAPLVIALLVAARLLAGRPRSRDALIAAGGALVCIAIPFVLHALITGQLAPTRADDPALHPIFGSLEVDTRQLIGPGQRAALALICFLVWPSRRAAASVGPGF